MLYCKWRRISVWLHCRDFLHYEHSSYKDEMFYNNLIKMCGNNNI